MRHLACGLCVLFLTGAARADYPAPQAAGFHHCALIYEAPRRGTAELAPYVADARGWLFDAFLFLHYQTSGQVSTSDGETRLADWREQLDTWFAPGRDLDALDRTIEKQRTRLGPVPPRRIMLSIPYPHPAVKDFGDVNGDGISEDLSTPQGQEAVARWYVAEAKRRSAAAGYRHLDLWGLYWMREGVGDEDAAVVGRFARAVHDAGLRLLWIPWYHAPGWQRWRDLGFDVAIMQPNYAFLDTHHGAVRRNRLAITAADARAYGLGVEIELPMRLSIPGSPRLFREYLRDGAAERYGYQYAATAYYLGSDFVERLAAAHGPLYADLAAYVHGDTLLEPDLAVHWKTAGKPAAWLGDQRLTPGKPVAVAQTALSPQPLEALDIFLDEPSEHWTGMIIVEGQAPVTRPETSPKATLSPFGPRTGPSGSRRGEVEGRNLAAGDPEPIRTPNGALRVPEGRSRRARPDPWQPVGWARREAARADDGRYQVVTVPLTGSWRALRVRFEGKGLPIVAELTPQPPTLGLSASPLAYRARYQVSPPEPAQYGDANYELTDGFIPGTGFPSGQTVGWYDTPVAVSFDLGEPMEITGGEVHLQGGSVAAVYWPRTAVLMLAADCSPPSRSEGLASPPSGLVTVPSAEVVVDRMRSPEDQDGHLTFALSRQVKARYATFLFRPQGWLMLSEIRLFSGGRNVLAGRPYFLQPSPTPLRTDGGYPDDGQLLTDGVAAQSFSALTVYGWADMKERTIDVDLGRRCLVDEVIVWSLTGSGAAIYLPSSVRLFASDDGRTWRDLGVATHKIVPADPPTACPFTLKMSKEPARYLRVIVTPSKGWSMISEIQVSGTAQ